MGVIDRGALCAAKRARPSKSLSQAESAGCARIENIHTVSTSTGSSVMARVLLRLRRPHTQNILRSLVTVSPFLLFSKKEDFRKRNDEKHPMTPQIESEDPSPEKLCELSVG